MITEEIKQAIANSLPKLAGEAVQERLKRADEMERLLASSQARGEERVKKITELTKELEAAKDAINDFDSRQKVLAMDEKCLKNREMDALRAEVKVEVLILTARLDERDRSMKSMVEFMSSVTKNTVYRETIMGNDNRYDSNTGQNSNSSSSLTTERSKE